MALPNRSNVGGEWGVVSRGHTPMHRFAFCTAQSSSVLQSVGRNLGETYHSTHKPCLWDPVMVRHAPRRPRSAELCEEAWKATLLLRWENQGVEQGSKSCFLELPLACPRVPSTAQHGAGMGVGRKTLGPQDSNPYSR